MLALYKAHHKGVSYSPSSPSCQALVAVLLSSCRGWNWWSKELVPRCGAGNGAAPMSSPGSRAMTTGLMVVLLAVSASITSGGGDRLHLNLLGVLTGVNLIVIGVRMTDHPMAFVTITSPNIVALAAFSHRNLDIVGFIMVSSAITAVAGVVSPALCFGLFALLLLGISLINIGIFGE
ncbi:uncharacterized protein LOC133895962 [Phragmites australis]|uniref:uncharacterized protein LOC133895962 n=1 Tax=Phragmites australis TaxID=29695 RepID=UPI002D7885F5|nr:uncharacterized protein LOC133895962 [Phragmites australis]